MRWARRIASSATAPWRDIGSTGSPCDDPMTIGRGRAPRMTSRQTSFGGAPTMSYSIWLDGNRIGETNFELRHGVNRHAGVFHPTELGLTVLPGLTSMAPALF